LIKPDPFSIGTLISIHFIKHSLPLLIGPSKGPFSFTDYLTETRIITYTEASMATIIEQQNVHFIQNWK